MITTFCFDEVSKNHDENVICTVTEEGCICYVLVVCGGIDDAVYYCIHFDIVCYGNHTLYMI